MSSTPPEHEIVQVPATQRDMWQKCFELRLAVELSDQVFRQKSKRISKCPNSLAKYILELDSLDEIATHLLLQLTTPERKPVGTIRISNHGPGFYKLSCLVVLKDYRQYGFGRELVLALHEFAREDAKKNEYTGNLTCFAHSQIYAKGFYARYGYVPEGEEFDEDGAPHQKMVATISL